MTIHVYIVGAGPGSPELLTRKAYRLLQEAEIIVCDHLISEEIMALIPDATETLYVGKEPGKQCISQEEINELLVSLAKKYQKIVRLKGGDPFVLGRGSEEAAYLQKHGITYEVVPGITAAAGCAAQLGIPLTHRDYATGVRFVTGHRKQGEEMQLNWQSLADPMTTLVIYMGLKNIDLIAEELIKAGMPADIPVVVIENGTIPEQRVIIATLDKVAQEVTDQQFQPPALIVVGNVVKMAQLLEMEVR